jgi:hypothetical protein
LLSQAAAKGQRFDRHIARIFAKCRLSSSACDGSAIYEPGAWPPRPRICALAPQRTMHRAALRASAAARAQ